MSDALALFAKAPVPGRVKTRLQPALSPEQAAALHEAFVEDTWESLQRLGCKTLYLFSDIDGPRFRELAGPGRVSLQRGEDLGRKMLHCFEDLHAQGHDRIVIVGSDSPTLPRQYLDQAFDLLGEVDAALGPAEDGGYYAVGCRRPRSDMFDDVAWSSEETLLQTEAGFRRAGLRSARLPSWYDVDTPGDLVRLAADPRLPSHTKDWLGRHDALVAALKTTA